MLARLVNATGVIPASVPPVTATSASPACSRRTASTNACTPEAQAAAEVMVGPWMPKAIET